MIDPIEWLYFLLLTAFGIAVIGFVLVCLIAFFLWVVAPARRPPGGL